LLDDIIELGSRFIPALKEVPDRPRAAHLALDHIAQTPWSRPWLLIYDNVENPADLSRMTPATGAHVLITTRWADWYGHALDLPINVLPREEAVTFLLLRAGRGERDSAAQLADQLGCLPVALDHAGAYCKLTLSNFSDYQHQLSNLIRRAPRSARYPASVFATFSMAIEKASSICIHSERLMAIFAFMAPDRIPLSVVSDDIMTGLERAEAVAALLEVSLLDCDFASDLRADVSVHRLVQQVMRQRLRERGEGELTAVAATELVARSFPTNSDDVRSWTYCAQLLPHALIVLDQIPDTERIDAKSLLLNQVGLYLRARADHTEAEPLFRRALEIDEAFLGPSDPVVAIRLDNLASLLETTNRHEEAEPLMRRALAITDATFGPNHPNVAVSLNNLALLLHFTGRPKHAEPLMRRALEINEQALGPEHPDVARGMNNLALMLQSTNRLPEAELLLRHALQINENAFGPTHPKISRSLNNIAVVLDLARRDDEAELLYRQALATAEDTLGPQHPTTSNIRSNLEALVTLRQSDSLASESTVLRARRSFWSRLLRRGR
jgi:tetratricopeptide (TPR) repeat protein